MIASLHMFKRLMIQHMKCNLSVICFYVSVSVLLGSMFVTGRPGFVSAVASQPREFVGFLGFFLLVVQGCPVLH